jgi:hypothetical protein
MAARTCVALAFLCGVFGLIAGLLDRVWKLTPAGWFTGGSLLVLIALFFTIDGALVTPSRRP